MQSGKATGRITNTMNKAKEKLLEYLKSSHFLTTHKRWSWQRIDRVLKLHQEYPTLHSDELTPVCKLSPGRDT